MSDRRWSLSAESITAAAAVVAALIALGVGVWENAQARRHNRLSVIPYHSVYGDPSRATLGEEDT